jgi:hypothetical protein
MSMRPFVMGTQSYHGSDTNCPPVNRMICVDLTRNFGKRAGTEEECQEYRRSILSGMYPVRTQE